MKISSPRWSTAVSPRYMPPARPLRSARRLPDWRRASSTGIPRSMTRVSIPSTTTISRGAGFTARTAPHTGVRMSSTRSRTPATTSSLKPVVCSARKSWRNMRKSSVSANTPVSSCREKSAARYPVRPSARRRSKTARRPSGRRATPCSPPSDRATMRSHRCSLPTTVRRLPTAAMYTRRICSRKSSHSTARRRLRPSSRRSSAR